MWSPPDFSAPRSHPEWNRAARLVAPPRGRASIYAGILLWFDPRDPFAAKVYDTSGKAPRLVTSADYSVAPAAAKATP